VDKFPPGMPKNLDAVVENGVVTLLWSPPDDTDLAGYRVYRREEGSAARALLQAQLVTTWSFRDDQAIPGKKYEYSVAAVDTHGNEGQTSTVTVEVK
jgi:fibronectin type 3 domain-containing protein